MKGLDLPEMSILEPGDVRRLVDELGCRVAQCGVAVV